MKQEQHSASKWKDKQYRKEYSKKWRERQKSLMAGVQPATPQNGDEPLSEWKKRQMERKARMEATQAHPLGLPKCPFCGAEYFRRFNGRTEPVKMDHCDPCAKRFYYYNGAKQ